MAIEIERLIATLEANFNTYDRALKKALGSTNSTFARIETRGKQMESRLAALGGNVGRGLLGFLAGGASLRGAQQLIDAATRIENALKVAGLSGNELTRVYERLFASAQRNAAPLESLVTLYGRAAIVQRELGVSTEELLGFTDNVALALRVAGTDAQSASGALLQLSQALGAGTVRAEEFNSILEGALPIAQAAAAGLKEAGGSVAALRQLVVDGKVSSEAFFRAFEAGAATLQDKVAGSTLTTQQAFQQLENALIDAAGRIDGVTGASEGAVDMLGRLAGAVNGLSAVFEAAASGPIGSFIGRLNDLNNLVMQILPAFKALGLLNEETLNGLAGGISRLGAAVAPNSRAELEALYGDLANAGGTASAPAIKERIAQIERELYGNGPSTRGRYSPATDIGTVTVNPVSLDDFDSPNKTKKSKSAKERADDYERLAKRITEATAETVAETEARRQLNPLVEDYGYAIERARIEHELLAAAQEAGKEITPALRAEIAALADQYGLAAAEAARLAEEHDKMADDLEFRKGLLKDALGGLRSALADGKLEFEELGDIALNVLDKIIAKIEDELANAIFKMGSAGGSGGRGILSSLLGGLFGGGGSDPWAGLRIPGFAEGTKSAPGGLAWVGEEGPELMNVPRGAQILPSDISRKIASGSTAGAANVTIANSFSMDLRGAQQGVGAEVKAALASATKDLTPAVVKALREIKRKGIYV